MAKPRQSSVVVRTPAAEPPKPLRDEAPRFTEADHVLLRLNTLEGDFQQVEALSSRLNNLVPRLDSYSEQLANAISTAAGTLNSLEVSHQELTRKSEALDASIAEARASAELVTALGEIVSQDHDSRWAETRQQLQHETAQLSQSVNDQIATRAGEIDGANQVWRTQIEATNQAWQAQIEATNQTWRKQTEATNQGWQLAQAQQTEQWHIGLSREMVERTGVATNQARLASKRAEELAEAITQLSERHSESQKELTRQMAADCAAWEAVTLSQAQEIAALRLAMSSLRKMLYGAGAVVLALLCIIAIFR